MPSGLLFTASPWFTLLCVTAGILYAWLLYAPQPTWSKQTNWLLAGLRAFLVATICFLLLSPRVRDIESSVDRSKIVVALDDSKSMKAAISVEQLASLSRIQSRLNEAGYETSTYTLGGNNRLDSIEFNEGTTDLSRFLNRIKSDFESRNLTDVVLLSDGIVNAGISPSFTNYPFKIHTVALGDTLPASDLRIARIRANQVAFLGNQFPVQVDVAAYGAQPGTATLILKKGERILSSRPLKISGGQYFETIDFQASSQEKGLQRYTIELRVPGEESNQEGRQKDVFIDVIDGRENILILALSPHPDLKALRAIIAQNENYELDMHILSSGAIPRRIQEKRYDLLILHQLPDRYNLGAEETISSLVSGNTPTWFIYGHQSAPIPFNRINRNVTIAGDGIQYDQVTGRLNKSFNKILLDSEKLSLLEKLPPVSVPFGEYTPGPGTEVILFQRIGTLDTQKPLLTVNLSGEAKKTATFLGDGLWRWRMEEFSRTGQSEVVDEMVLKLIQLLAIKEDKRKFRVTPSAREYTTREPVVLQTEVYNDLYERIYGQAIDLSVTNEHHQTTAYQFVNLENQPSFRISGLPEGAYQYTASTTMNGKKEEISGRFLVRDVDLESLNMTADHGMLRELSSKTGGHFILPQQIDDLISDLVAAKAPDRLTSTEKVVEIIHLKWLFFLLVALATLEWATRKYLGGY